MKTRDACRPELAVEPSCSGAPDSDPTDTLSSSSGGIKKKLEVARLSKKKKDDPVLEALGMIKNAIENDPVTDMISYLREEAERSREHEMRVLQMVAQQSYIQQQAIQQPIQQQTAYEYEGVYYEVCPMWPYIHNDLNIM